MKKILLRCFLIIGIFLLSGCGNNKEDVVNKLTSKIEKSKSYYINGELEIINNEDTYFYDVEVSYKEENQFKVLLKNKTNNHEQIILRNSDGVYVLTPSLNKSFKFQSEWPDNSSQAYLLGSIASDIKNDTNTEIEEIDDGYIIKSSVNYPNNEELTYQKIYLTKDKNVEKVEVFNTNDIVKIKVIFESIDLKAGLNAKDFNLNDYVKEEEITEDTKDEIKNNENNCTEGECQNEENTNTDKKVEENDNKTASIENIIYPLYIPSNTYLTNSETIETSSGNRVILTFSGEKNFVLIEEATIKSEEMSIVPVYGEPVMLSETIGALSANSLSWDANNVSYYLASTELTVNEMRTIANSLGNTTLVNSEK